MLKSYGIKDPSSINYDEIGKQFGKHANSIVSAIKNKKNPDFKVVVKRNIDDRVKFKGRSA